MLPLILVFAGFVLGIAVGRWWVLLAAVAFGIWIGTTEEVEVSGWVLGVGYGGLAAIATAFGLLVRRGLGQRSSRSSTG
jgi:nitrate reductase gamma subunit